MSKKGFLSTAENKTKFRIEDSKINKSKNPVNKKTNKRKDHQKDPIKRRKQIIKKKDKRQQERLNGQKTKIAQKTSTSDFLTEPEENSSIQTDNRELLFNTGPYKEKDKLNTDNLSDNIGGESFLQQTAYQPDLTNGMCHNPILNRVTLFNNNEVAQKNSQFNHQELTLNTENTFNNSNTMQNDTFVEEQQEPLSINLEIEIESGNLDQLDHLEIVLVDNRQPEDNREEEYLVLRVDLNGYEESNGLTTEEINSFRIGFVENCQTDERCTVCIEDFGKGEEVRVLPCDHIYHLKCIDTWLVRNGTCPVCKFDCRINK